MINVNFKLNVFLNIVVAIGCAIFACLIYPPLDVITLGRIIGTIICLSLSVGAALTVIVNIFREYVK